MRAIQHVWSLNRFTRDVEEMTGVRPGLYWQVFINYATRSPIKTNCFPQLTWRFISPILILVILISSLAQEVLEWPTYHVWSQEKVLPTRPLSLPNKLSLFRPLQFPPLILGGASSSRSSWPSAASSPSPQSRS